MTEFIERLLKERLKEKRQESERRRWELWLHKVWDQSYQEFSENISKKAELQVQTLEMDKTDIKHAAVVAFDTLALLRREGEPC